jgi:hypothetical protein
MDTDGYTDKKQGDLIILLLFFKIRNLDKKQLVGYNSVSFKNMAVDLLRILHFTWLHNLISKSYCNSHNVCFM